MMDAPAGATGAGVSAAGLTGVPETLLWPLYNRAAEARRPDALLDDPAAVRIADAIDYDYARHFGPPKLGHVIRARLLDNLLRDWLRENPDGQVAALGEGLETQSLRVDNGRVRWLSVDLPESIALRKQFLPDTDRHRNLACSALDPRWMDELDRDRPTFVTAAGLLMYLEPVGVRGLIASIAGRFPGAEMAFDTIPRWISRRSHRGLHMTRHYRVPVMPWGIDRDEIPSLKSWHPNIAEVRDLPLGEGRGFFYQTLLPAFRSLPWLGKKLFAIVHIRCRRAPA